MTSTPEPRRLSTTLFRQGWTITPWQDVRGVLVTIVSEIGDQTVVSLKIDEPALERSSGPSAQPSRC